MTLYSEGYIVSHTFANGKGVISLNHELSRTSDWFRATNVMSKVIFPNTLKIVGSYSFFSCKARSIELQNLIEQIGVYAFRGTTNLATLIIKSETPPSLAENAFYQTSNSLKIYVPDESVDVYKAAENWSYIADKIFPISDLQ